MPTALEFSEPKQLGTSQFYTQVIWDEDKKKGFIAILKLKADGTFERCTDDLVQTYMKVKAAKAA
ncbi:MAG: hypothetical protein ACOYNN_08715 [Terrimicrobiaceae bacterium]